MQENNKEILLQEINEKLKKLTMAELKRIVRVVDGVISDHDEDNNNWIEKEDFSYLTGLSEETKNMITSDIANGKKNLYHSVMAVLNSRFKKGSVKDAETEAHRYIQKYKVPEEQQENIKELVTLCYGRMSSKRNKNMVKVKNTVQDKKSPETQSSKKRIKIKVPNWNNYR